MEADGTYWFSDYLNAVRERLSKDDWLANIPEDEINDRIYALYHHDLSIDQAVERMRAGWYRR